MTLVSFNHVDLTAETDEHIDRVDVENVLFQQIHQGEVKVRKPLHLANHLPSICFCSSVIDDIVLARSIEPPVLYLNLDETAVDVEDEVVWKIVSERSEHAPPTL